jgi:hypothetical protein
VNNPGYVRIEGADLPAYVQRAQALLEASRLSQAFPDVRGVSRLLGEMARDGEAVMVSTHSGWPLLEECTRIRGYPPAAQAELKRGRRMLPARRAELERLAALVLPPVSSTRVVLVEELKGSRRYQVWRDAYDLERDKFMRLGVHFSTSDTRCVVLPRSGVPKLTGAFESTVERLSGYGCRAVWGRLTKTTALQLEEVSVATLGPLQQPMTRNFHGLAPLFEGFPQEGILQCGLERASLELDGHRGEDPFADASAMTGFEVGTYRERRWTSTAGIAPALTQWLLERNVKSHVKVA